MTTDTVTTELQALLSTAQEKLAVLDAIVRSHHKVEGYEAKLSDQLRALAAAVVEAISAACPLQWMAGAGVPDDKPFLWFPTINVGCYEVPHPATCWKKCHGTGRVLDASLLEKADGTPQPERLLGVLWKVLDDTPLVIERELSIAIDAAAKDPSALIVAVQVLVEVAK
ncbi:hypothetical protein LCGC14_1177330 [marine sediment metagenome]|uniref:Uncharacterized protein n=1 Tax=marine sediment metagenome TaxID=412755 RepID=A0A0F9LSZ9_9ZZZZ